MFKKGLTPELRTLLTPQIYSDFNTLMNMAILTERAKTEEKKENKCKFMTFPEAKKLRSPHVQVLSPHAVQNPVTSHGLSWP
jgi:hypothetical protein